MNNFSTLDIAVIGGGASGLAAAITAKKTNGGLSVAVFEANSRVGKKLLTTGNGQCNLSNAGAPDSSYHGSSDFALSIIKDKSTAENFLTDLGIVTTTDERGRMYPYSRQASAVLDALRFECENLGVEIICDTKIEKITKTDKFTLFSKDAKFYAKKVIYTVGSNASVKNFSGYALIKTLGHTVTKLYPSIVQLKTDIAPIKAFKGIKTDATVSILQNGKTVAKYTDELLFTEYGISGPAVMYISRYATFGDKKGTAKIDFCPDKSFDEIKEILTLRRNTLSYREKGEFLNGFINKRIGQTLANRIVSGEKAGDVTDKEITLLSSAIKGFEIEILGSRGFDNAQVTAGGVPTNEINPDLSSKKCSGLYFAGEIVDVDGDCGGYNLLWAWSSGVTAGENAAKRR